MEVALEEPHNDRVHELLPEVYDQLRRLARGYLRPRAPGRTLQPTALVHEAFLKMQGLSRLDVKSRTHLVALAAVAMRQILVDHVRASRALKRGGDWQRVTLESEELKSIGGPTADFERLEASLGRLERVDPEEGRLVELKFFGGLSEAEIAAEMGRSVRWVRLHWAHARGWVRRDAGR